MQAGMIARKVMMRLCRGPKRGVLGTTISLAALMWWGCNPNQPLPPERVCEEVGYAIANRTVACDQGHDLAVARYDRFKAAYSCVAGPNEEEPVDSFYTCPVNIGRIPCDQVELFGDDLDLWLSVDEVCGEFLVHEDGTPIIPKEAGAPLPEGGDQ